jgi:hypothetical protein
MVTTQACEQSVSPVLHRFWQECAVQNVFEPDVQAVPHPLQFAGSWLVSVQTPPQSVSGATHWQVPATHACPLLHAFEHEPQWPGSFCRFTHAPVEAPGQYVAPVAHAQAPATQLDAPKHIVVQFPQ